MNSSDHRLSVVIPTYNNQDIIERSLNTFFTQTLPQSEYEVIVIDDGSTDGTLDKLKKLQTKLTFKLITQSNSGPAYSRNRGVEASQNEVIFFSQGDIFADQNLLQYHLQFHQENPIAESGLVGHITWHPELKVTPFMYWLEHGGPQFDFGRLEDGQITDFLSFYTPNLSLKREFLKRNNGFDEDFHGTEGLTAYEDTELGWRLAKDRMQLTYNPNARAYHYHPKTLDQVIKRRFLEGQMSARLYQKHPDFSFHAGDSFTHDLTNLKTTIIPDRWRHQITKLVFNPVTIWPFEKLAYFLEEKLNLPLLFKIVCGYHYNRGITASKKTNNVG